MKLKTVKKGGAWYVVSTIYEPPRAGSVGSGVMWCKPYATREEARLALARIKAQRGWK